MAATALSLSMPGLAVSHHITLPPCCSHAGSADARVAAAIRHYVVLFRDPPRAGAAEVGRPMLEACLHAATVALGLVMAGTGDLGTLRLVRGLAARPAAADATYGGHMAAAMATGLLFLGGGTHAVSSATPGAVAALVAACYPVFPASSWDNRGHLQALRHLYVLAAEPRVVVPRDADTGRACYAPLTLRRRDGYVLPPARSFPSLGLTWTLGPVVSCLAS